nr:DUF927 domain-containing protein [uncultured Faecalimonas sp.]
MAYEVVVETIEKAETRPVYYKEAGIEDGQYGKYKWVEKSKEWKFVRMGGAVYVKAVITNIDTQEESLQLYFDRGNHERVTFVFPRQSLNESKIVGLTAMGVQVKKTHADTLIKTIENQERNAERIYRHEILGMDEINGRTVFKGATGIGVQSEYQGQARIFPKGSYKEWKNVVEEEVMGQIPLEFLLAVSVSGMLVDCLKEKISISNVIVHCVGESSTGKTTGALLAVSTGSAPDFLGNNFVFTFQDTLNSLMRSLPNSFVSVIDEGSLLGNRDMTNVLYSLSSGVEKRRLTQSMSVQESARFRTALILTSEKSILSQCNNNSGLLVRNFEFQNVEWTKDAQSADRIKSVISMNYGHIVPKVAERLLQLGEEKIIEMLSEEVETIVEHARKTEIYNNLTERTAKQSALILVAVDILSEVMGLTFHKEEIRNFMEEHSLIKDTEQVSLGKRAMEWLLQYISKNRTQFLDERVRDGVGGCRGRIQKTKEVLLSTGEISDLRLYIADSEFVEILREGKFSEKVTVLKEWKEMGYLKAQRDRYISNIKILQDISVKGYIVLLPVSMKDQWEEVEDITEIPFED